jgi:hypothetical protein
MLSSYISLLTIQQASQLPLTQLLLLLLLTQLLTHILRLFFCSFQQFI